MHVAVDDVFVSDRSEPAVNGGQIRFNNAGTTTSALTLSNQTFTAGQNAILVIAPPATGTTAFRTFLVTGC